MKAMVSVLNHGGLARFACALKSADSLRDACINFIFYKLWNFIFHKILRCISYFYGSAHISYPLLSRLNSLLHSAILSTKFYIIEIQPR